MANLGERQKQMGGGVVYPGRRRLRSLDLGYDLAALAGRAGKDLDKD
jgi:hypothetical protein